MTLRQLVFIVVLSLFVSVGTAAELPVLIVSDGGYAWMIAGEDGKPVLYEFSQIIVLGKGSTKPPPVVIPSEFGLDVQSRQWLLTVPAPNKGNAVEIARAMMDSVILSKAGKFSTLGEMEAALGVMLGVAIKDKPAWQAFGASLQTAVTTLKSPVVGKIKTPDDLARALSEVARGIAP